MVAVLAKTSLLNVLSEAPVILFEELPSVFVVPVKEYPPSGNVPLVLVINL